MSITLDVNAFLNNNDICIQSGYNGGAGGENKAVEAIASKSGEMHVDDITMEKEMETNGSIFDEIEHLLKFNKNLEFPKAAPETTKQEDNNKVKKSEGSKQQEAFTLDFLTSHTDDFLLASDTQSILSEEPLLFSVEKDHLQPLTSRFMVPGIYKRIEGVDRIDIKKNATPIANVFITSKEKTGRIIRVAEFNPLYGMKNHTAENFHNELTSKKPLNSNENKSKIINAHTRCETNKSVEKRELKEPANREWCALQRLATDIYKLNSRDHIVIDVKRNEIVKTQYGTNQKTIYRLRNPEMMGLKAPDSNDNTSDKAKAFSKNVKKKLNNTKNHNKKKSTAREKSSEAGVTNKPHDSKLKESDISTYQTRTRSGRLVKTIQTAKQTSAVTTQALPPSPKDSLADILTDLRDKSFKYSKTKLNKPEPSETETLPPVENSPTSSTNRKIPPGAICPTCHKIFLGKRLQRHFAKNPDHIKVPVIETNDKKQTTNETPTPNSSSEKPNSSSEDISLFRFLVNKLNKSQQLNEDQKADLFLTELNDLVEQLQIRSSRLIHNTSGLHFVNQKCAKLLGIPEGQYALDMTAIEGPLEPEMHDNTHVNNHTSAASLNNHSNSRCLDYTNLSITLDNTLTDEAAQKLNLSAGGKLLPPSEESLLRAVDDLVQTDITKLQTTDHCVNPSSALPSAPCKPPKEMVVAKMLPPHIDHASDNAVEAVHMKETLPNVVVVNASENPLLDLSVDFFQFNN